MIFYNLNLYIKMLVFMLCIYQNSMNQKCIIENQQYTRERLIEEIRQEIDK